ncbi:2-hydroxychromene-2-carboxylate isomerase [Labrys miyagiensis]|uniref:2-hydroxychromene-2-carboxylate isomerase n=2 Tax=Labrys miyagiensis TaxID=346912 RepID=A0ABQ6CDJ5_9HYPH|nr:2-hydroxychromene-2-carboxylate isomerase [Labrys miyagiensis]
MAQRHGLGVRVKPVLLGNVFAETGGPVLAKRHPARQRYRLVELQRWRDNLGLSFHLRSRHWPFDPALADRLIIAIERSGGDALGFFARASSAFWEKQENLADEATLQRLADEEGLDGSALLAQAQSEATAETYRQNLQDAVTADVFGSPAYVLDGEVFWGQDRLGLLEEALISGRPPFRPEANGSDPP